MKCLALILAATALLTTACDKKADSGSSKSTNGSVVTAPVDYLDTALKADQRAVKTVDTTTLDKAVQLFNVDKGRNPKDLNELVEQRYIPKLPPVPYGTHLSYDAASGRVTVDKN
jgi:hypothetical protein